MFNKFQQIKGKGRNLYRLNQLKKQMGRIVVTVEEKGVEVVMQGDQVVQKVVVDGREDNRLRKVFNKAIKASQKKVAKKMQGEFGGLGMPGM